DDIMGPSNFCNQWLQFFIPLVFLIKLPHQPKVPTGQAVHSGKFFLQIFCQCLYHCFPPFIPLLPGQDGLSNVPIQTNQLFIYLTHGLVLCLVDLLLDLLQKGSIFFGDCLLCHTCKSIDFIIHKGWNFFTSLCSSSSTCCL